MNIACEICFKEFNELDVLPKVLECGHSICCVCLSELIKTMKRCPSCRKVITKSNWSQFPTNFLILGLITELNSLCIDNPMHIKCSFEALKRNFIEKKKILDNNIDVRRAMKNIISIDLATIQKILACSEDSIDINRANETMVELTSHLNQVNEVVNCGLPVNPRFILKQFKNEAHFLYQIAIYLHKEELVFAMERVNGEPKYGQVTADNDMILVHALTLSSIADVQKPKSVILFEDLRKCMNSTNFSTFLEFTDYYGKDVKLFFSMTDSVLTPQFMELCTGERGPSYKGSLYVQGTETKVRAIQDSSRTFHATPFMKVENYMANGTKVIGPIQYDFSVFTSDLVEKAYCKGKLLLVCYPNGSFSILRNCYDKGFYSDVVGINSDYPDNTLYCNYNDKSVILDSGIAFKLQ